MKLFNVLNLGIYFLLLAATVLVQAIAEIRPPSVD